MVSGAVVQSEAERKSAERKAREAANAPLRTTAVPTAQGGAAAKTGMTRRQRAGGGWHVSSAPTKWSKMLRANPHKIGRSVKVRPNHVHDSRASLSV